MNLKPSEVRIWEAYRYKYGPMSPVRMFDAGPAIIAALLKNIFGGKGKPATPQDFMPYGQKQADNQQEHVVDSGQFLSMLMLNPRTKVRKQDV